MATGVFLGMVDALPNGDTSIARVLPLTEDGVVSRDYPVIWYMRHGPGKIAVGDKVIAMSFDDGTGLVISFTDGDWTKQIDNDIKIVGQITCDETVASGISLTKHTHTCPDGTTSAPQ